MVHNISLTTKNRLKRNRYFMLLSNYQYVLILCLYYVPIHNIIGTTINYNIQI